MSTKDKTRLIVGLLFFVGGLLIGLNSMSQVMSDRKAQGVVVAIVRTGNPPLTSIYYHDRVAFLTQDHRLIEFTDPFEEKWSAEYPVGRRVSVYYDPRNPQSATINAWSNLWEVAVTLMVVGGGFALYSVRRWIKSHIFHGHKITDDNQESAHGA